MNNLPNFIKHLVLVMVLVCSFPGFSLGFQSIVIGSRRDGAVSCASNSPLHAATVDGEAEDQTEQSLPRRQAISSLLLLGAAGATTALSQTKNAVPSTTDTKKSLSSASAVPLQFAPISSLDDAVDVIASSCDKRFWHAVVASDYELLYYSKKGFSNRNKMGIWTPTEDDFVLNNEMLEQQLEGRDIQPRKSIMAHSNLETAKILSWSSGGGKRNLVSLWPLSSSLQATGISDAHFAWPEVDGTFVKKEQQQQQIIVDGIDCGRMSLEDALEGNKEILVQADRYLVIPQTMEQRLIDKLQTSFII